MNCYVCGKQIDEGSASCSNCGFPMIVPLGAGPEITEQIKNNARQYRETICAGIEVGFCAYTHKIVKDSAGAERLECERADNIPLGTCADFHPDQIRWYPEMFVRPHKSELECFYYIKKGGETKANIPLRIRLQPGSGDIQIGVRQVRPGIVRFCVGSTMEGYSESNEIDVLG